MMLRLDWGWTRIREEQTLESKLVEDGKARRSG
jgi:hypothetical protein